jgi:hypothetical protein
MSHFGGIKINVSLYLFFISSQVSNILLSIGKIIPCELSNWSHNCYKILNKTSIKLCHVIEHLNMLWILWYKHVQYRLYFLWIRQLTFFETINPIMTLKTTIKLHFTGFKLMMYFLHFWKHNITFYKWVSMSL